MLQIQVQVPEAHFLKALVSCGAKAFCATKKYKILTGQIILKGELSATFSALHGTATWLHSDKVNTSLYPLMSSDTFQEYNAMQLPG